MGIRTRIVGSALLGIAIVTAPVAAAAPSVTDAITAAGGACGPIDSHGEYECVLYDTGFRLVPGEAALAQTASVRRLGCATRVDPSNKLLTDGHWFITTPVQAELGLIQTALAAQGVSSSIQPYCP